jgi:hypothetical protein
MERPESMPKTATALHVPPKTDYLSVRDRFGTDKRRLENRRNISL